MQSYIYAVKSNGTQAEFNEMSQAITYYNAEKSKGNCPELFRTDIETGNTQRYQEKPRCNCPKCAPKKIQYHPRVRC